MTVATMSHLINEPLLATDMPVVSLYLENTYKQGFDGMKLQLKNLTKDAVSQLEQSWPEVDSDPYAQLLRTLRHTPIEFAVLSGQSVAVFTDGEHYQIKGLPQVVATQVHVGELPFVIPLVAAAAHAGDFDILALQGDQMDIYTVHDGMLAHLELPEGAPVTLQEALGYETTDGALNSVVMGSGNVMYHGHGSTEEEKDLDRSRYYKVISDYITTNISHPHGHPLILVGLADNVDAFAAITDNPQVISALMVKQDPSGFGRKDWLGLVAHTGKRLADWRQRQGCSRFEDAMDGKRALLDLGQMIEAFNHHAVGELLIQKGAHQAGRWHDGEVDTESARGQANNLVNDLAALTLAQGGRVTVLDQGCLPKPYVTLTRYAMGE